MVCNNYLEHLCGSIQYKHTRTVYDPGYAWPRFALIRFQLKDRFVAIRFKQTTDSYLIRFLILAASRFLGAPVDSIRFDSKRFCFFRFRTGSIPYVQRFRLLNRFGTILYIYIHIHIYIHLHYNIYIYGECPIGVFDSRRVPQFRCGGYTQCHGHHGLVSQPGSYHFSYS